MANIYDPKIKIVKLVKTSTAKQDADNDNYKKYTVTAEVSFDIYGDTETENQLKVEAMSKLDHVFS